MSGQHLHKHGKENAFGSKKTQGLRRPRAYSSIAALVKNHCVCPCDMVTMACSGTAAKAMPQTTFTHLQVAE
jgi:hypothetical protein